MFGGASSAGIMLSQMVNMVHLHFFKDMLMANLNQVREQDTEAEFKRADRDSSGDLDKFEFVTYMLLNDGVVSEQQVDILLETFNELALDDFIDADLCIDRRASPVKKLDVSHYRFHVWLMGLVGATTWICYISPSWPDCSQLLD